jgi:hypothetical protein
MSDDLLKKADALLQRYHPAGKPGSEEIPVLTEVVAESGARPRAAGGPATEPPPKSTLDELEQRLRKSVLDALGPNVVSSLEEPLRTMIEERLRRALGAVADQVRADVEALVRDAVTRAVEQEISRLREPSRGNRP